MRAVCAAVPVEQQFIAERQPATVDQQVFHFNQPRQVDLKLRVSPLHRVTQLFTGEPHRLTRLTAVAHPLLDQG
ncbi:hypothetical protein HmCmsJML231_04362 [Escherichia coli]|nr:hypothetical protein HmCmsJML231_04362 [Escherichia coli]